MIRITNAQGRFGPSMMVGAIAYEGLANKLEIVSVVSVGREVFIDFNLIADIFLDN